MKAHRYAFVAELLFLDSSQNPPDVVGTGHEAFIELNKIKLRNEPPDLICISVIRIDFIQMLIANRY